jgi:transposase
VHDRDNNAAKNILERGLLALEREFSTAGEARAIEAAVNKAKQLVEAGHGLAVVGIPLL